MRKVLGLAFLIIILVVFGTIVVSHKNASTNNKIKVVAGENFWGNIVSQIGGKYTDVTSIITNPNADPHLYESSANDAEKVVGARLIIVNGVGYDDFMTKLISASGSQGKTILTAQDIYGVANNANPHLWYNINKLGLMTTQMELALSKIDPSHSSYYQTNLKNFNSSLQPIISKINYIKQKYSGTAVAYTEPVPGYLLADCDLTVLTPPGFAKAIEDGVDPSPADINSMDSIISNKQIKVLLYNSQTVSPVTEKVKSLAYAAKIPVIGVSETLPASASSYQTWQLDQINSLISALGG